MTRMLFCHNDGGRAAAGFKGSTGDCGVRAAAIVLNRKYRLVYDDLFAIQQRFVALKRKLKGKDASPRLGVYREVLHQYLIDNGCEYVVFAGIGVPPTRVFQVVNRYPNDRVVMRLARHYSALIEGINTDTWMQHPEKRVYSAWIYRGT